MTPNAEADHLLVTAADGTAYAIPFDVLESYRLADEDKEQALAAAGGEEVAGFDFRNPHQVSAQFTASPFIKIDGVDGEASQINDPFRQF